MAKSKRRLTASEEFEIYKMVLDKFLWLGFGVMAFGLYKAVTVSTQEAIYYIFAGVVVLILFLWLIVREYEIIRR